MRRCLELAAVARDRGDTPVGSVVVLDGAIIGEGIETLPTGTSITGHAETLACQAALGATGRRDLAGATLYTTAEPCFMCSYAIRQLRVDLVVYGKETPVIGAVTSVHPILTDPALNGWRPAPAMIGGVLREECERLKRKPGAWRSPGHPRGISAHFTMRTPGGFQVPSMIEGTPSCGQ